jgi:superfamily II DNA or RNA helicase
MKVEVVDSTWLKAIDNEARREITKLLKYEKVWFKQGKYSKIPKSRLASFVDSRSGLFLCGFLPRIKEKFPSIAIVKKPLKIKFVTPKVEGITFRKDQIDAIMEAVYSQRGVIHFATASGKTVIAAGIISCFDIFSKTVFLAHSKDIVNQTYERFKEYGFDTGILTGEKKENESAHVICATIQTYLRYNLTVEGSPDIVIVDECHHVNSISSQYGKLLRTIDPPIRIGLGGTLPNSKEGKLSLEGLIGPVIAKLTIQEGIEKDILSLPKITLLSVRNIKRLREFKQYYKVRDKAVVNNRGRNMLIVRAVNKRVKKGKSCLIIVNEIKHGENLQDLFSASVFLQGKTPSQAREKAKQKLINKKHLVVITTNIWNEGVDIPTLDVVILAFGGKANTRTIQAIGRGLRRTKGKRKVEIIDFLDPYRFLAEHIVARLNIYKKEGLLQ